MYRLCAYFACEIPATPEGTPRMIGPATSKWKLWLFIDNQISRCWILSLPGTSGAACFLAFYVYRVGVLVYKISIDNELLFNLAFS